MNTFSPELRAEYLCSHCGRHWGFHRASDEACPAPPRALEWPYYQAGEWSSGNSNG
jgi:hypothetical protein